MMTPLAHRLEQVIAAEGPISVARYMDICLNDPEHGYYRTGAPIGAGGDFVTAPEVSQMFGELIGLWCAVTWRQIGAPETVRLVELGPGKGTLMQDALRAAATAEPEFRATLSVHLVETGERLRVAQAERLAEEGAAWHASLNDVPSGPALLIANEFFDALPVHQYVRGAAGWRERLVTVGENGLAFVPADTASPLDRPGRAGEIFERAPARACYMAEIAERVARHGGAALVIDYGHAESANGDTLQAVRAHRMQPVFAEPGLADLTSHVDFQALGEAAAKVAAVHGPVRQGAFLRALGIETRAALLQRAATPEQAGDIDSALHRLIDTRQMGDLFKVMAVTAPDAPLPAGFEGHRVQRTAEGGGASW